MIAAGASGAYRVTNAFATGSNRAAAAESTPMASANSAAVSVKAKSAAVLGVSRLGLRHALLLLSRHRPAEIQLTVHRAPPDWTHPGKVEAPYTVCIASASNLTGLVKSSVECRRTGL